MPLGDNSYKNLFTSMRKASILIKNEKYLKFKMKQKKRNSFAKCECCALLVSQPHIFTLSNAFYY